MADETGRGPAAQKRKRKNTPQKLIKTSESTDSEKEAEPKKAKTAPQDVKDEIRDKFKMEMPQDFYDFWEFCKTLDTDKPECALSDTLGLELVGPYDVLAGKFKDIDESSVISYHLHWRYYYDPPEFQTVVRACNSDQGYHIGYFRDDPKSLPVFLASNQANIYCEMTIMGGNLFSAVSIYLSDVLKKCKDKPKQNTLKKLQSSLTTKAKEFKYNLSPMTPDIKARNKNSNSKTFHKAGMVVPVDATEVGYRPLTVTDGELKKILRKICEGKGEKEREDASEELQEILTYVQFANDECDYGMGLELGLDIFCFGEKRFNNTILQLMPLAYRLLGRDLFAEISEIHIKHRERKELSQVPTKE